MNFIDVAAVDEIPLGGMLAADADGDPVILFRHADNSVKAFRDRCTHADVALSEGECAEGKVTCPAHGAQFDTTTGKALCMPAVKGLKQYQVRIEGARVLVALS